MKKIIALFVIMVGFSFTAQAQQKKVAKATAQSTVTDAGVQKAAAADVKALDAYIPLNAAEKQSFTGLFEYKHQNIKDGQMSAERIDVFAQTIEAKIKATLTPENLTKLEGNPKLLKQLTH